MPIILKYTAAFHFFFIDCAFCPNYLHALNIFVCLLQTHALFDL